MIDILKKIPPYISEAQKQGHTYSEIQSSGHAASSEFISLAEKYPDVELIGNGHESIVLVHPNSAEKVISYSREKDISIEELKQKYYAVKILETLFPTIFPRIQSVYKHSDGTGIYSKERIHTFSELPKYMQLHARLKKFSMRVISVKTMF